MTSIAPNFIVNLKCQKQGHETQPIMYVCEIGACKDRLVCSTCLATTHQHHTKSILKIPDFLLKYINLEERRNAMVRANQQHGSIETTMNHLQEDRKNFEEIVQNEFNELMKLSKIIYENAMEKFKIHNKLMNSSVFNTLEESKQIIEKKEPKVEEQMNRCNKSSHDSVFNLLDSLLRNVSLNSTESLDLQSRLKQIPTFNAPKFATAKDEILEYAKQKLKNLLEFHDIHMNDASWHSRSTEMLKEYIGHTDHVNDMTVCKDGTLVTCSKDRTIRFWDTNSHTCTQTIRLFDKDLQAVCTLASGNIAVAKDNKIEIYSPTKNEIVKSSEGHTKTIRTLYPLPDGNFISAGDDKSIKLWDGNTGMLKLTSYGHDDSVRRLHLTKDNKVVSASNDFTVKIWDMKTGETLKTMDSNKDYVLALDVMSKGHIVTGSRSGQLMIWDPLTNQVVQSFSAHNSPINSVVVLQDGSIATGSSDNTIKIWNPKTGSLIKKLEGHKFPVRSLKVLLDGNLASCGEDNKVIIWASKKVEVLHTFQHDKAVWSVAALPNKRFVSGSEDKTIKIWSSLGNGGKALGSKSDHTEQVRAVLFIGNNKFASASSDKTIKIYNATDYSLLKTITGHEAPVRSLSQSPSDPSKFISGSEDKTVKLWDANSFNCLATLSGHDDFVRVVQALANSRLASGSRDNTLRIWNMDSKEVETILRGHQLPIWSILELEPGKKMATGSSDYTIRIWDLKEEKTIQQLHGHTGPVWALAKLGDSFIASGSEDCMLKLWDWESGDCVRSLFSHSYAIWGIAVDEAENIATASWDKTVKIWNVKNQAQLV